MVCDFVRTVWKWDGYHSLHWLFCIVRRTKINLFIMHFFYANLASADLLMGICFLTIALVDAITLGHFSEDDVEWRTGPGCRFAGFCAITSTMVSVYTLVVITAERLYTH